MDPLELFKTHCPELGKATVPRPLSKLSNVNNSRDSARKKRRKKVARRWLPWQWEGPNEDALQFHDGKMHDARSFFGIP